MPRPLKWGILGAGTIILSENIHKNAGKVTLIFADSHVICLKKFAPLLEDIFRIKFSKVNQNGRKACWNLLKFDIFKIF